MKIDLLTIFEKLSFFSSIKKFDCYPGACDPCCPGCSPPCFPQDNMPCEPKYTCTPYGKCWPDADCAPECNPRCDPDYNNCNPKTR